MAPNKEEDVFRNARRLVASIVFAVLLIFPGGLFFFYKPESDRSFLGITT